MSTGKQTILITGAAGGIGRELALRAAARGDTVFAAGRKLANLQQLGTHPNLHPILMDVSDTDSVSRAFAEIDRLLAGRKLDAVINSAAISTPGAIEIAPMSDFEQTYNTNALGSLRVLKESIPRLRGHGGRLLLVTSLWGRAAGPMLGSYCSSKHTIEALADIARRETVGMNLHIVVVEPGVVKTDMLAAQASDLAKRTDELSAEQNALYGNFYRRYAKLVAGGANNAISATRCAQDIEKALFARKPKLRYRVGTDAKLVCFLAWLLPDRVWDALFAAAVNHKPL